MTYQLQTQDLWCQQLQRASVSTELNVQLFAPIAYPVCFPNHPPGRHGKHAKQSRTRGTQTNEQFPQWCPAIADSRLG